MGRFRICGTLVAALVLAAAPAAAGHGPCTCLSPILVEPGQQVRLTDAVGRQAGGAGYPAYRVVFNPRPSDFGIAPGYLAGAYRADVPTSTVLSRPREDPTRKGRFRVPPATPDGLYLVLIWDGDEAGAHNTWGYLHVANPDASAGRGVVAQRPQATAAGASPPTKGSEDDATPWTLIAGTGLAGLFLGALAGRARSGRGRSDPITSGSRHLR
jgi:hypothetical protein